MTARMFPRLDLMDVYRRLCEQRIVALADHEPLLADYCQMTADKVAVELTDLGVRPETLRRVKDKAEEKMTKKTQSCLTSKE